MPRLPRYPLQDMLDGMSQRLQKQRAQTQTTLGELIEALEPYPSGTRIEGLGYFASYRGFYEDLAICQDGDLSTVGDMLAECRAAMGEIFCGYKGGDYVMGRNTPIWVVKEHSMTGRKLMGVEAGEDGVVRPILGGTAFDDSSEE